MSISAGDVLKVCEIAWRCYRNCRDCTGEYKTLTAESRALSLRLQDVADKYEKIPDHKQQHFQDAYEPCIQVLQDLDKLLVRYNGLDTKTKRTWDRLTHDPDKLRALRERLTSSVTLLDSFYTSLMHDNQVLIMDALARLENDYRGGHREESIASLERITSGPVADEDEQDEAAWTQILRDLEDVGVAKHDAISYRHLIIDWLVRAVNEGRLLEERAGTDVYQAFSSDLELALPNFDPVDTPGRHHVDIPSLHPSHERSQSTPSQPPSPVMTSSVQEHKRARSIPSTASISVPELSIFSSYAASQSSETDNSSLYAPPEPISKTATAAGLSSSHIRRIPVPNWHLNSSLTPAISGTASPVTMPTASSSAASLQSAFAAPQPPTRAPPPIPQPSLAAQVPQIDTVPVLSPLVSPSTYPEVLRQPAPLIQPLFQVPPSYYDKTSTETADLAWTAQQAIAAWSRHDFVTAAKHLEEQLGAVERGHTVISTGTQPDRRVLRHLIGVCYSLTGEFAKAKTCFEGVFNGIYLNGTNLDDGDIAAARWLGDVCLHLREHCNAALAWGVALEGSIGRYGAVRDRTRRVGDELRQLDHYLLVIRRIENSFQSNVDPTTIFRQTHAAEKSNLIATVKARLYEVAGFLGGRISAPNNAEMAPSLYRLATRPKFEAAISSGFLLTPLITPGAWPMPWDTTFSPLDAVQLDRQMNSIRISNSPIPLVDRTLPSLTFGDSKKLHYITKRGSRWLIETVKQGLEDMCIEHAESPIQESIVCMLNQHRDGYAWSEGVEILFRKLQFRSLYGMRISDVKWSTRKFGLDQTKDTTDFREILKSMVEQADEQTAKAASSSTQASQAWAQAPVQKYG
ncbi:hypothetical protein ACEQ8H_003977 [Pleosporales sp. CAS-2024a]